MQEWRHANSLPEDSSKQPQPHYEEIKSWFRHGVQGTTHKGHPVWVMKVLALMMLVCVRHVWLANCPLQVAVQNVHRRCVRYCRQQDEKLVGDNCCKD